MVAHELGFTRASHRHFFPPSSVVAGVQPRLGSTIYSAPNMISVGKMFVANTCQQQLL